MRLHNISFLFFQTKFLFTFLLKLKFFIKKKRKRNRKIVLNWKKKNFVWKINTDVCKGTVKNSDERKKWEKINNLVGKQKVWASYLRDAHENKKGLGGSRHFCEIEFSGALRLIRVALESRQRFYEIGIIRLGPRLFAKQNGHTQTRPACWSRCLRNFSSISSSIFAKQILLRQKSTE